ncbi:hypothetical protein BUALT_Bualt03G0064000 [Buddleja alternifolia]|uniref:B3 domain-containing protein n=1 Tax=Buddleja alternifolia TaxID=168488 RepID=A0AAV6Y2T7_9LAMI|nr:hypothetical protein BUALT_Bualt03G0064000 [Buddleja alternifolia]
MSSSTAKVCFNANCKEASEKWRRGWRRRTGEYAQLCDRCASAYEEGKFCETFHLNASGWRCCESCGKTPNPAWPPPSHFLPSQPERMKDLSVKTWSAIAGSGPVPWRQAPSLFNSSSIQSDVQPKMPFEIDVSGGVNRFCSCERLSTASPETKQERSYERLGNGKLGRVPTESIQNGNAGLKRKEQPHISVTDFQQLFPKNESSSNLSVATASSSKMETDTTQLSAILIQAPAISNPVGKQVCSPNGMDSYGEVQIRNGKARGDGRGRNQLLPRYRPQITDEELQQISSDSKSVITPLFEKMLSASDAGRIGRLVLPKKCAEAYFPPIAQPEGLPLNVQDVKGKEWVFQFRFWPNNNSRMYVLEGITPCIQSMQLQAGDVVTFSRLEPEGKLVMGGRKSSANPSTDQGDEVATTGCSALTPQDGSARNKSGEVITINGHIKGRPINQDVKADTGSSCPQIDTSGFSAKKLLGAKPIIHGKRKNSNLGVKNKRLRIENVDVIELNLTCKEAQRLMRPPAKIVPSVFVVEGCEFEEFEENAPVIGRPTIAWTDHFSEKIQWVQCEDCFKWRKVPADVLLPSRWICSDNAWDLGRSQCSTAEELTNEQLEDILPTMNKVSSEKRETTEQEEDLFIALEGLDTLANLAIQGEGEGVAASSETRTKHPRHKPGCTCIVCLQPPSGKGSKHKQSCDCVVCSSLRRRFKTLMERREKKQLEKEYQNLLPNKPQDIDSSLYMEEASKFGCPDESNGKKSSISLKGQIDLNIQPEREEELSPGSDCAGRIFKQQRSLGSDGGGLVGKQMQQAGNASANFVTCMAVDGNHQKTG